MLDRVLSSPRKISKRVRQLLYFSSHLPQHAEHMRTVRAARSRGVASTKTLVELKYLGIYLAEFLSTETRRNILAFHYGFLIRTLASDDRARLWTEGTSIWHRHDEALRQEFSIRLEPAELSPMEGECQLCFLLGDKTLCTLTFSFVHGASIGLPPTEALFIGGVQGGSNCRQEIRVAAKANGEIAPAAVLILAAKAIAEAFGVGYIVGVSTEDQAAMGYARDKISLSYDAMWLQSGAVRTGSGFFIITPGLEKPLDEIPSRRRSRTRRKRLLKLEIKRAIRANVEALLAPDSHALRDKALVFQEEG